jgi:DNA modification methylase
MTRSKKQPQDIEHKPSSKWRNRIVGHAEVDPTQLLANPKNWRIHPKAQQDALTGVLDEVGWVQSSIVNKRTGFVLDGHLRAALAIAAGERVPVVYVDLSEQEEDLILATLDPLSAMAVTDEDLLAALVGTLDVTDAAIQALLDELAGNRATGGLTDEDAIPELPVTPTTVPGDLWLLGDHRLYCGNATVPADVTRLMHGEAVDLIFTDPPYNVDYEGYTENRLKIKGDRMTAEQFAQFLLSSFASCRRIVKPGASMYVCHSSSWQREFQNALEAAGFDVRCQIIWAKNTFAWGFGRYKFQHEPIFYSHVAGQKDAWYGDKSQATLWGEKKPAANRIHPTAKPVELVERALVNSSKAGDIVADLFGGSGSTLIGCERRGRKARLMEIDPKYADCIVRRWQDFTGHQAVLEDDGQTFLEASRSRVAAAPGGDPEVTAANPDPRGVAS